MAVAAETRGPIRARCEDWTRRKELLFRDAGIVVWDRGIPPDTRLAGSTPCLIVGVHRDHHLALDLAALIRGFRTPALRDGRAASGAGVRKPPKEETAGRLGAGSAGATYGDFGIADEARLRLRRLAAGRVRGGSGCDELFRVGFCTRRRQARRLERDWRSSAGSGFLLRRAA